MRASEAITAMLEISQSRGGVCLPHRNPYTIRGCDSPAYFREPHGGILMISFTAERRWIFASIVLMLACCLPAAAQEQRRGFYTPSAADTVHAVVAEHG